MRLYCSAIFVGCYYYVRINVSLIVEITNTLEIFAASFILLKTRCVFNKYWCYDSLPFKLNKSIEPLFGNLKCAE